MNVERGFFYDNGSVLVNEFLGHGNLLDLINHYRLKVSDLFSTFRNLFSLDINRLLLLITDD